MKMTVNWLQRWIYFFSQNSNYERYCKARAAVDTATCDELEQRFSKIADLYQDWGDVPRAAATDIKVYMAWGEMRQRGLFFRPRAVKWIDDPATYVKKQGHLLLEVPLSEKLSEVMEQVQKHMAFVYAMQAETLGTDKPASKVVLELPTPKYMLHAPSGNLNAATAGAVNKAIYVDKFRHRPNLDGKKLSITDTVLEIKRHADNPLGWSITDDDKGALKRGTFAKSILGGSEVTLIKRHRRDFDAYVRNTIHGRFPDNS
jgi:hypothetical protein